MTRKYRKKVTEVEAIQFSRHCLDEALEFADINPLDVYIPRKLDGEMRTRLMTKGGWKDLREDDYILRDKNGKFSIMNSVDFHREFEELKEEKECP